MVVRVLVFIYEEQTGWVTLAGKHSTIFSLTNGTRQGSVISPVLFSVYLDDLLAELRKLQLGCHIGGYWLGGCGYADDLILLAPSRDVLQRMLEVGAVEGQIFVNLSGSHSSFDLEHENMCKTSWC